jgi:sulfate adenylyltransferase
MEKKNINGLKSIILDKRQLCDLEMILIKAFYPLKGFMNKNDYNKCVNEMRLSDNSLWAMPITLSINEKQKDELKHMDYVVLKHETGIPLAVMDISNSDSIYKPDIENECEKVFGTTDYNHPGVKLLKDKHTDGYVYNIGGDIIDYDLPPNYDFTEFRLTPEQTKKYFREQAWSKVVGFQTRNPMHRSHYELTKYALKMVGDDAKLLLQPTVGITQSCDVDYHTRVRCYKKLMNYYPKNTAMLSLIPLAMRMGGPREAVWHAQIRKNYGCTHFVIGREHASPSFKTKNGEDFYGPYDAQELLMKYADEIGIKPIPSKLIIYAIPKKGGDGVYMPIDKVNEDKYDIMKISGTEQRSILRSGKKLPDWFTFPEISKELLKTFKGLSQKGLTLYLVGLSGSGKSTVANFVISKLKELTSREISYLDGDIIRQNLSKGLGFTPEDRSTNVRRIGFVCSEITKHGGIAVVANIAPYENDREYNREIIEQYGTYVEVFVNTSLDKCEKRDVKGLYKMARDGVITKFTGIDDPFEAPVNPEIVLDENNSIEENVNKVIDYLVSNELLDIE